MFLNIEIKNIATFSPLAYFFPTALLKQNLKKKNSLTYLRLAGLNLWDQVIYPLEQGSPNPSPRARFGQ